MRREVGRWTVRTRDALALAAVLVIVAVAALLLTTGSWGGGGMMGGMMGGAMAGVWIALVIFVVAIVFVVLALAGNTANAAAPVFMPAPPPNAAPMPPPATPAPPAIPVTSDVEAAIVRMLDEDEKLLYLRLRDAGAPVLQKDIVGWGTFSAAKVTRLLDRLEGKGLLVRERYGMTNRIRLARQPISGK